MSTDLFLEKCAAEQKIQEMLLNDVVTLSAPSACKLQIISALFIKQLSAYVLQ
jgi:hypothetical protein